MRVACNSLVIDRAVGLGFLIRLEFRSEFFVERRNVENPEKNPWNRGQ